ncbi:MAG: hypothetical protein ACLQVD_17820 [Capsulimonadaceae bacterium]
MLTKLEQIKVLLNECTADERAAIFAHLRHEIRIHVIEDELNVRAEVILDAIHRASDLSLRGVRGLIAEASFEHYIVNRMKGWISERSAADLPYDFLLTDNLGPVRVQVKLQRLVLKQPMVAKRLWQEPGKITYVVETQKTRSGKRAGVTTRPYHFGEFDIIAVSMHPSTRDWSQFHCTLANWLLPSDRDANLIGTLQPVPALPDEVAWTSDVLTAIRWLRGEEKKRIWVPTTPSASESS